MRSQEQQALDKLLGYMTDEEYTKAIRPTQVFHCPKCKSENGYIDGEYDSEGRVIVVHPRCGTRWKHQFIAGSEDDYSDANYRILRILK